VLINAYTLWIDLIKITFTTNVTSLFFHHR